jgi:hypothetical protein
LTSVAAFATVERQNPPWWRVLKLLMYVLADYAATEKALVNRLHFSFVVVNEQAAAQGRGNGN